MDSILFVSAILWVQTQSVKGERKLMVPWCLRRPLQHGEYSHLPVVAAFWRRFFEAE
jgi:hypothetical protein